LGAVNLDIGDAFMKDRIFAWTCSSAVVVALVCITPGFAIGQDPTPSPLRTLDGQPDLQGIWSFATITPLERPQSLAGKEFFTEDEARAYEIETRVRTNKDRRDGPAASDVSRAYNDFWWDPGTRVVQTLRTSLVIDPPDGRIPPMTPAGRDRQTERRAANVGHEFDGPENRPLPERCLIMQGAGPPTLPTAYNNNTQIVQGPGYVALLIEMGHEVRIIPVADPLDAPLDNSPHLPDTVRLWKGDSRGHWEGDTLVVDTTNFSNKTAFRGTSENMHLTERFTRRDEGTLIYQFTVDDPATYERPWSVEVPLTRSEGQIYEYACHEGNYGMAGALAGARAAERRAAESGSN
jgi:hypothetical protein